jgi:hypothetical protein
VALALALIAPGLLNNESLNGSAIASAAEVRAQLPATEDTLPSNAVIPAMPAAGVWEWETPRPQGNQLYALSCPSASTCFAVGEAGTILATTNGGNTWTI